MTEPAIILVIDDNPDSLQVLNETLSAENYTVLVATGGDAALSILQKTTPSLVLLDANMPGKDGFETCQLIKLSWPHVPIIFMTGMGDTKDVVRGLDAGAVDYLVKPLNHTELLARVKVHINNARMTRSSQQALDTTGQHMAAVGARGDIIWTTDQARSFINNFSSKEKQLFLHWLTSANTDDTLDIQQGKDTLVIKYTAAQEDGSHLLKFKTLNLKLQTQTLKNKLKITRREADVLYWVAQGKTDWEISKILSISERTVNKHLEQVYRKLEVNNRTSASAYAIHALG